MTRRTVETGNPLIGPLLRELTKRVGASVLGNMIMHGIDDRGQSTTELRASTIRDLPELLKAVSAQHGVRERFSLSHQPRISMGSPSRSTPKPLLMQAYRGGIRIPAHPGPRGTVPTFSADSLTLGAARAAAAGEMETLANLHHPHDNPLGFFGFTSYSNEPKPSASTAPTRARRKKDSK